MRQQSSSHGPEATGASRAPEHSEALALRLGMREQLRAEGLSDSRLLQAMASVPRHAFLPGVPLELAYGAEPLPLECGQILPAPLLMATMLQALELRGGERVLEVGTGSGYQAALLGHLAQQVFSLELLPELFEPARDRLSALGYDNVRPVEGDGGKGYPDAAPFHAIVVGASVRQVPQVLIDQLEDRGRLVIAVGDERDQLVVRLRKSGLTVESETLTFCTLPPLIGQASTHQSWPWMRAVRPSE